MSKRKKLIGYVMSGVLSVGIVGGMGASALAITSQETNENTQKIKDELKALGITPPSSEVDKDAFLANLDEATKDKIKAIKGNLKANTLSRDEAMELRKQRINLSKQDKNTDKFANVDVEARAKAKEIGEMLKAGTITKEEAFAILNKLGISLPNIEGLNNLPTHLEGGTKAKVEAITKKLEEGTITKAEAAIEIRKLRVNSKN